MSLFRGIIEILFGAATEAMAVEEAADVGYDTAMNMCGNEGQVSVIDMTGYDAFYDCADILSEDTGFEDTQSQALAALMSACPYPEAVSEILEESFSVMVEIVLEARGDAIEEFLASQEEEEEEEESWD